MSLPLEFLVKRYGNIRFMYIDDVKKFVEDTPFKKLLADGRLDEGPYSANNYSNIFRILLLHLYGGVYFDLDVISLQEFSGQLPLNFAVAQDPTLVNNAILRFSKRHPFLSLLMKEIVSNIPRCI